MVVATTVVVQTTVPATTPATTLFAAPTTVATTSSSSSNNWIWLLVALVVIGAVAAILIAQRRRKAHAAWAGATNRAVAEGKVLVDRLQRASTEPGGTDPALQTQLQVFDATLASLESNAPSTERRSAVAETRAAVAGLNAALDADLQMRIGPPAPTAQQLDTSQVVLDQRTLELDESLDRLAPAPAPTT